MQAQIHSGSLAAIALEETSSQGFEISADVTMIVSGKEDENLLFQLTVADAHVSSSGANGTLSPIDPEASQIYSKTLASHPMIFALTPSGLIDKIMFANDEPAWSVNFKRGILSVFQVTVSSHEALEYESVERDSAGQCVFKYTKQPALKDGSFVLTKINNGGCDTLDNIDFKNSPLLDSNRFSTSRVSEYKFNKAGHAESIQVKDDAKYIPVQLDDVATVSKSSGTLSMLRNFMITDFYQYTSMEKLEHQLSKRFGFSDERMIVGDLTIEHVKNDDVDDSDFDTAEIIDLSADIEFIAQDRLSHTMEYTNLVRRAREDNRVQNALLAMVSSKPTGQVAVDVLVATGNHKIFRQIVSTKNIIDLSDVIYRVLVGIAYLPPFPFTYGFVRQYDQDNNEQVRRTSILALGAIIHNEYKFSNRLCKEAIDAIEYLEVNFSIVNDTADRSMYLYALGNSGQDRSAILMMPLLDSASSSAQTQSDVVNAMRRMEMRNVDQSVRTRLQEILLRGDGAVNEPLRIKMLELLIVAPRISELSVIVNKLSTTKSEYIWKQSRFLLEKYIRTHDDDISKELSPLLKDAVSRRSQNDWPWQRPIIDDRGEARIAGTDEFGAYAGYSALVYNPVMPYGQDKTIVDGTAYSRVIAFNQSYNVVEAHVSVQGDVNPLGLPNQKPVEAYAFISVGGTWWIQCINVLGNACGFEIPPAAVVYDEAFCYQSEPKELINWGTFLFSLTVQYPLVWGITLDLTSVGSAYVTVGASAKGCLMPARAQASLTPKAGLHISGGAAINAYVVRAGASVNAKILHSNLKAVASLNMSKLPVEFCGNVELYQQPLRASIKFESSIRDRVKYCGKNSGEKQFPCGLSWGSEVNYAHSWVGLEDWIVETDLVKYCKTFFGKERYLKTRLTLQA